MAEQAIPQHVLDRVATLRAQITHHNHLYYDLNRNDISDEAYDALLQELKALEETWPQLQTQDSPTMRVGGLVSASFEKVSHRVPMLSLQDVFSQEEVRSFVRKIQGDTDDPSFVVERKIDGLSVSLRYEGGRFVQALTRGDGHTGEDVTANARMITSLPRRLRQPLPYLEVRGEVFLTWSAFDAVNRKQDLLGEKRFANPRNCAAGTLRQLDPTVVADRQLSLFVFNIQDIAGKTLSSHAQALNWLAEQGFVASPGFRLCSTEEAVWQAVESIGSARFDLPYAIDGAVIKLDRLADRDRLGETSQAPRWAVAYKYPPEQQETTVLDIRVQVGRTGRLTPMALLQPVQIAGTQVSRATLHNQDVIDALDVRVGDRVVIQKAGDIIPAVLRVVHEARSGDPPRFVLPTHCPACGEPTRRDPDGADVRCINADCPAQLARRLQHFASKEALSIDGLGPATVEQLLGAGYLAHLSDLYLLADKRDQLIESGLIGKEKTVDKLLAAIDASRTQSLDRLITGLGIRHVGRQVARILAQHFKRLEDLAAADEQALLALPDIGPVTAEEVVRFFSQDRNRRLLIDLQAAGVQPPQPQKGAQEQLLAGQVFVLTGRLPNWTRSEAKKQIEQAGGRVADAVTASTHVVVAGEGAGRKLEQARQRALVVVDEAGLRRLLDGETPLP